MLYQYTPAPANAHRAALPFQLRGFCEGGAVLKNRRAEVVFITDLDCDGEHFGATLKTDLNMLG